MVSSSKVPFLLLLFFIKPLLCEDTDDLVGTINVPAVVGRQVSIPCNIQPDNPEDRVYMVLWFREAGGKPIYSFDVRGRSLSQALHWSDPAVFGARASFDISTLPASLTVLAVEQEDEGIYRCRVDFKNSPTRNFILNLISVVPPHQVILYNAKALDLAGVVGPLVEHENFTIFCEVRGGKPEPTVSWSMDNTEVLDHEIVRRGHLVIVSKLQVTGARRDWLNKKIICQASNTDLIPPLTRSARIEMHLPPSIVQIALKPEIMYAGEKYYLTCISVGSRPIPDLVWYKNGHHYAPKDHLRSFTNDTCTVATALFIPSPSDHGKRMECVSRNNVLDVSISDEFLMTIYFKPEMTIMPGDTYDPQEIRVNDDIYFECDGNANPPIKNYTWYFNGKVIEENKEKNIFKNLNRLIIRHVTREHRGLWSCQASNRLGPSKLSDPMYLRVRYKPVCAQEHTYYGVKLYDQANLRCTVHGDPDILDFTWIFNSKRRRTITKLISGARTRTFYNGYGTTNELPLLISSEMDYGTLSCYANNSIGRMEKPCVIEVVVPSSPEPPSVCITHEISFDKYIRVTCLAGYSGGLAQYFSVDAINYMTYPPYNRTLRIYADPAHDHNPKPYWPYPLQQFFYTSYENVTINISREDVKDLLENEVIGISAHNYIGSSIPTLVLYDFYAFKLKPADPEPGYSARDIIILLLGSFCITLIAIAVAIFFFKLYPRPCGHNNNNSRPDNVATQPLPLEPPREAYRQPSPPASPKNLRIPVSDIELQEVVVEQYMDGTHRVHRAINIVEEIDDDDLDDSNLGPFLGSDEYPDAESPIAPYASSRLEMVMIHRQQNKFTVRETKV